MHYGSFTEQLKQQSVVEKKQSLLFSFSFFLGLMTKQNTKETEYKSTWKAYANAT